MDHPGGPIQDPGRVQGSAGSGSARRAGRGATTLARREADRSDLDRQAASGRDAVEVLREQSIPAVLHGFPPSFRDWCGETGQPREVAEVCLAHAVWSKVEAAYAQSDLLNRRRILMQAWADYLLDDP